MVAEKNDEFMGNPNWPDPAVILEVVAPSTRAKDGARKLKFAVLKPPTSSAIPPTASLNGGLPAMGY